jgi:two-component system, OmpR family, phosphate regulon sensor histidine kinase PhoR
MRVKQVLVNLIDNALKYGKENGVVEIRFYDMDENILIEIADDGLGIPEKHLSRLFERFYRVDSSRSRDKGGSGLGLAIVKHIIEAHGQTINVRSTEGKGSTFSFTLKMAN